MFCLDGKVVFIHSRHVNKIGSITLILVVTCGYLKNCLRGVEDSVSPEFASYDSKNECTRTKNIFSYLPEVSTGTVALWVFEVCHNFSFWVCHTFSFWVLSQFDFLSLFSIWFLSLVTIWGFCVLSQFEFLSFVTIWFFEVCHSLSFFIFVTIWIFKFCHNLCS